MPSDREIITFAERVLEESSGCLRLTPISVEPFSSPFIQSERLISQLTLRPDRFIGDYSEELSEKCRLANLLESEFKERFGESLVVRVLNVPPDDEQLRQMVEACNEMLRKRKPAGSFTVLADRCVEYDLNDTTRTVLLVESAGEGLTDELEECVDRINEEFSCGAADAHPRLIGIDSGRVESGLLEYVIELITAPNEEQIQLLKEAGVSHAFFEMMTRRPEAASIRIRRF